METPNATDRTLDRNGHTDVDPARDGRGAVGNAASSEPSIRCVGAAGPVQIARTAQVLEDAMDDLAAIIRAQEVMQRRGFAITGDTRHHLEELVRALTPEATS